MTKQPILSLAGSFSHFLFYFILATVALYFVVAGGVGPRTHSS